MNAKCNPLARSSLSHRVPTSLYFEGSAETSAFDPLPPDNKRPVTPSSHRRNTNTFSQKTSLTLNAVLTLFLGEEGEGDVGAR